MSSDFVRPHARQDAFTFTPPVESVRNGVISVLMFAEQIRYCVHNTVKPTEPQAKTIMFDVAHDADRLIRDMPEEWTAETAKRVAVAAFKRALENIER